MTRRLVLAGTAAASLALLVACGGAQTDERVAGGATTPSSASAAPAATAAPEGSAAPDAGGVLAPYVSLDCTTMQATPVDALPDTGASIGQEVNASQQASGSFTVTVASDAPPATALQSVDITVGTGAEAQPGDIVTANYCGVGLGTLSVFDSSYGRGAPATFPLDQVIPGWQQGVPGMKVGGSRLLLIPSELAYGEAGAAPSIQPNESLVFVVELQGIG